MTQDFNSAATAIPLHAQLFKAAMHGDLSETKRLIAAGAALESRNTSGHTPLMLAASRGHLEVAAALLDAGADVDALSKTGASALASTVGLPDKAMADLLLSRGADPLVGHVSCHKNLLRAAVGWGQEQLFTKLVEGGTDFRFEDEGGRNMLMLACSSDQPRILELLIAAGMDLTQKDNGRMSPAEHAAEKGSDACLRILLDHGVSPEEDRRRDSLLYLASKKGAEKAVALLLERGTKPNICDDDSTAPLRAAIQGGHAACVDLLLQHGADPMNEAWEGGAKKTDEELAKAKGGEIEKLVTAAARKFHLVIAAGENDTGLMKTLLDEGIPIETVDRHGKTALLHAVQERKIEAVKLLLEHHANPNYAKDTGRTPLYAAIMKLERYSVDPDADPAMMELLLAHGADPNALHDNKEKESMLWIAVEGKQAAGVAVLLAHKADPNIRNGGDERTPLFAAALNKDPDMVKKLIEAGARVDVKDKDGVTLRAVAEGTGERGVILAIEKQYDREMEQMGEDATRLNTQMRVFKPFQFKPGAK
ncbi:MAG: hypothetical protein EPN97_00120 [Alphaproteobacteria bacterium]|nr:MAG: hypothetical protein EPN97_00120 [Alphaproteobacteria bacterium]